MGCIYHEGKMFNLPQFPSTYEYPISEDGRILRGAGAPYSFDDATWSGYIKLKLDGGAGNWDGDPPSFAELANILEWDISDLL